MSSSIRAYCFRQFICPVFLTLLYSPPDGVKSAVSDARTAAAAGPPTGPGADQEYFNQPRLGLGLGRSKSTLLVFPSRTLTYSRRRPYHRPRLRLKTRDGPGSSAPSVASRSSPSSSPAVPSITLPRKTARLAYNCRMTRARRTLSSSALDGVRRHSSRVSTIPSTTLCVLYLRGE